MYNADMGRNRKIGSAHSQLFTNLISVFYVYTKLETVSDEVKRKATHIIAGNEDDGVAKFLMNQWFPPSFLMSWFSSV